MKVHKNKVILTHKGRALTEADHREVQTITEDGPEDLFDHFAGVFDDVPQISATTGRLLEAAAEKIRMRDEREREVREKVENLEKNWPELKNSILGHKLHNPEEISTFDDDYNTFITDFQDSKYTECESLKKPEEKDKNPPENKKPQLINSLESADRLESGIVAETKSLQKPDYFIIPQEYFKAESSDKEKSKSHTEITVEQEEAAHYIIHIWSPEFKKIPKTEKNKHFEKLLHYFLSIKMDKNISQSIYEHFLMFSRLNPEYFKEKMINILKKLIDLEENNHTKNIYLLFILSKVCPSKLEFSSLFEFCFQICVFLLSNEKNDHEISLNYSTVLYEFCKNSSKFCPEVISFFSTFQKAETYDPSFLSKYLRILICYMKLWRHLCCFNKIFNFINSLIKRVDSYLEIQEFVDISLELKSLLKEKVSEPLNNNFVVKKKKILTQYEPLLIEVKPHDNKPNEKRKILKRLKKREFRGAVRSLRRDNEMKARNQISEVIRNDEDRKNRVKELMKDISRERAN